MSTLLELQRAVYRGLVAGEDGPCAVGVVADGIVGEARLSVYRNTFIGCLTTALRLVYPAIHRLVGAPFFESAARRFIHGHVAFVPHPSVGLVKTGYPVDAIWRAVLAEDDAALAAIDLAAGPVWLMVERDASGVEVLRLAAPGWRYMSELAA